MSKHDGSFDLIGIRIQGAILSAKLLVHGIFGDNPWKNILRVRFIYGKHIVRLEELFQLCDILATPLDFKILCFSISRELGKHGRRYPLVTSWKYL